MILHFLQFNLTIHNFKDMGNFAVYDKDCRNFELHASMLGMQSVEYKMTISNDNPVKIHYNYT